MLSWSLIVCLSVSSCSASGLSAVPHLQSFSDRVISCWEAVKESGGVGQHTSPWWHHQTPPEPVWLDSSLCLICLVNNCPGFTSHHCYSNHPLLRAKELCWPRGLAAGHVWEVFGHVPALQWRASMGAAI